MKTLSIARVQVLHLAHGRMQDTRLLRQGEKAEFVVVYRRASGLPPPAATLSLSRKGKTIRALKLRSVTIGTQSGFAATLILGQPYVGTLWSHFIVTSGGVQANRDRKLVVQPVHGSD